MTLYELRISGLSGFDEMSCLIVGIKNHALLSNVRENTNIDSYIWE